ncbi:MAG: 2-amino-4-hydroxy-6-hydroxymethyldihydropteridine diphosphokinase [Oligoflexales bacterium]|nr:2-amino-4-hydroxy-6-hydroxymethyldihydropteridine diphosphokinase [Oligoflexales bacterium]
MVQNKATFYRYLLSFGSNLGNRHENCEHGLKLLSQHLKNIKCSRWISTPPLRSVEYDTTDHGDYLNFVLEASSSMSPPELYRLIVKIEDQIGHSRADKWLPRQLDIDILFYAEDDHHEFATCSPLSYSCKNSDLVVPHTGFWQRDFLQKLVHQDLAIPLEALQKRHQSGSHESK